MEKGGKRLNILEEEAWLRKSQLCQTCDNAGGPDMGAYCDEYHMPLYMVARKHKCKNYNEYWE